MRPGSSDTFMTLLGSVLLTGLLFLGRYIVEQRLPSYAQRERPTWNTPESPPSPWTEIEDGVPDSGGTTASADPGIPATPVSEVAVQTFKVIGVIDGDTADILVNKQPIRLRFNGIDTPEKGQPFGDAAKKALSQMIAGKYVSYIVRDTDRYNRSIADLYLNGVYVNKAMVEQGLAWHYVAYSDDPELSAAEEEARAAGRGLWSDPRRVAPWNWRKLSKIERDAYR